ncbi:hypothetical protein HPG69_003879, partial [Diceros bicornis minor]
KKDLLLTQQVVVQVVVEVLQVGLKFNTFQSDKFLNLWLRMVPFIYQERNLEIMLASRLSTTANVGKMNSSTEKWNIIIEKLSLKQVQATAVGFLAVVAAIMLGWVPEGKYYLGHSILLCSSRVATTFTLLQGIIMFGQTYNFSTLSWVSQGTLVSITITYYCYSITVTYYYYSITYYYILVGGFFLVLTQKHSVARAVLCSSWDPALKVTPKSDIQPYYGNNCI